MTYRSIDALRQSIGGYLHQDWGLDFETVEDAISASVADHDTAHAMATIAEIDELLGANLSEVDLWAFLVGAGCSHMPETNGRTCREFLQYVRDRFAVRLDA